MNIKETGVFYHVNIREGAVYDEGVGQAVKRFIEANEEFILRPANDPRDKITMDDIY